MRFSCSWEALFLVSAPANKSFVFIELNFILSVGRAIQIRSASKSVSNTFMKNVHKYSQVHCGLVFVIHFSKIIEEAKWRLPGQLNLVAST